MSDDSRSKSLFEKWKLRNNKAPVGDIKNVKVGEEVQLSSGQLRLWFLQAMHPNNAFYNYCDAFRFQGRLHAQRLLESFDILADRHHILRTTFHVGKGEIFQKVNPNIEVLKTVCDLQFLPKDKRESEANRLAKIEANKTFDLENGPLFRIALYQLEKEDHLLVLTMHHIITDGWSMQILKNELSEIYQNLTSGEKNHIPEGKMEYADYVKWQLQQVDDKNELNFWVEKLSGDLPLLNLPTDKIRPAKPSYKGAYNKQDISIDLSNSLKELAKKYNTTLFVLLLSAFKVLMSRYTNQDDILVGTPISNRNRVAFEKIIGFFNNTIVIRSKLNGSLTFKEVVSIVKEESLRAFSNSKTPFETIVKAVQPKRHLSINPIFQTMFLFHGDSPNSTFVDGVNLAHKPFDLGVSKFDLTLYISEENGHLSTTFEYAKDLFKLTTISRFQGHFRRLLENIVAEDELSISHLEIITDAEKDLIFNQWNYNKAKFQETTNIHSLIERFAKDKKNSPAVTFDNISISYNELNKRANGLANHLISQGIRKNDFVGICMDRSIDVIVSILGILKSGGAYLPLDPEYPLERIKFMTNDSSAKFIITNAQYSNNFEDLSVNIIDGMHDQFYQDCAEVNVDISGNDRAYLIYTSGSSGQPKGIAVTHSNLIYSTLARQQYYPTSPESFLLLSSFSFDSSIVGIFWTLCTGGNLVIPEYRIEQDLDKMGSVIFEKKITHTLLLPSLYKLMLMHIKKELLQSLDTVIVAGETCPKSLLQEHFDILPKIKLYNEYGPTEASVWSTVYELRKEEENQNIPIGKPIPNAQIYILDNYQNILPLGIIGEIYIGGKGITNGYLNREDLTSQRFIKNPFNKEEDEKLYRSGDLGRYLDDGNIEFLGRIDQQVKIRGYRIEKEEIRNVILMHDKVNEVSIQIQKKVNQKKVPNCEDKNVDIEKILSYLPDNVVSDLLDSVESLSLEEVDYMSKVIKAK